MAIEVNWDKLTINIYISEIENIADFFVNQILPLTNQLIQNQENQKTEDELAKIENQGVISRAYSLKYKMIGAAINSLIETWEQQVFALLKDEKGLEVNNDYKELKPVIFSEYNLNLDDDLFKELRLYRYVNNFLKHGQGGMAETKLKNTRFFQKSEDYKSIVNVLHTGKILDIKLSDVLECKETINNFWKELLRLREKCN